MKKHLSKLIMLFCLIAFVACGNELNPGFDPDDYEPIVPPEPVRTLTSMASGERVVLSGTSIQDIVLSWVPTEPKGNTVFRYEVLFDTIGGDFTKPIEMMKSDKEALSPQLSISHFQMNAIGKLAKFKANSNGTLRWRVRAYCGLDQVLSSLEGSFTIFMMDGIDDVPGDNDHLYITGLATEDNGNPALAPEMKQIAEGIYQIYTKLKQDKTYTFICEKDGKTNVYYYSKDKLRQRLISEDHECESTKDGIFRITLNFNSQEYEIIEVTRVYHYYHIGPYTYDLTYLGYGKWGVKNYTVFKQKADWAGNGETRHRFKMEILTENGAGLIDWGNKDRDAGFPGRDNDGNYDHSYLDLYELSTTDPWDYSFRYDGELLQWGAESNNRWEATVKTDITLYFNNDFDAYTHRWTVSE